MPEMTREEQTRINKILLNQWTLMTPDENDKIDNLREKFYSLDKLMEKNGTPINEGDKPAEGQFTKRLIQIYFTRKNAEQPKWIKDGVKGSGGAEQDIELTEKIMYLLYPVYGNAAAAAAAVASTSTTPRRSSAAAAADAAAPVAPAADEEEEKEGEDDEGADEGGGGKRRKSRRKKSKRKKSKGKKTKRKKSKRKKSRRKKSKRKKSRRRKSRRKFLPLSHKQF